MQGRYAEITHAVISRLEKEKEGKAGEFLLCTLFVLEKGSMTARAAIRGMDVLWEL